MTNETFVKGLRQIADLYEENPHLSVPSFFSFNHYISNADELKAFARAFGSFEKVFTDDYIRLTPKNFEIPMTISCSRGEICKKRVVGTKTVLERYVPGYTIPATTEDVVEWDCGSILDVEDLVPASEAMGMEESSWITTNVRSVLGGQEPGA